GILSPGHQPVIGRRVGYWQHAVDLGVGRVGDQSGNQDVVLEPCGSAVRSQHQDGFCVVLGLNDLRIQLLVSDDLVGSREIQGALRNNDRLPVESIQLGN